MIILKRLIATGFGCLVISAALPNVSVTAAALPSISPAKCTITGTANPDRILGTAGNDVICGLTGNDVIFGKGGNDLLLGGPGNDQLSGDAGQDVLVGAAGDDKLVGGAGTDTVDYSSAGSDINANLATGTATGQGTDILSGDENLTGGAANDTLTGDASNNVLSGASGNDLLLGGPGNDQLTGNAGRDMLFGNPGNDSLIGGTQVDSLLGGAGIDTLTAGTAGDTCATDPADIVSGICQTDHAGPAISEVAAPSSVDAGTELVISWRVSDPSGLRIPDLNTPTAWALLGGASGFVAWCGFPVPGRQVSGDMNDGLFTINCLVPANAVDGTYSFSLDALDVYGNHPSASTTGSFMVTSGASDSAPPQLSNLTMSGKTFAAGDAITFEWDATDDTGASYSVPWAFGPNGFLVDLSTGRLWLDYGLGTLVSGTTLDGHYRVTLQLSSTAPPGTYTLWFSIGDVLGNKSFAPVGATFAVA